MVQLVKPVDKPQSEEEPLKSNVSSLWSPFHYMLIENNHNLSILAPISTFLTSVLLVTFVQYINKSRDKSPLVTDFTW